MRQRYGLPFIAFCLLSFASWAQGDKAITKIDSLKNQLTDLKGKDRLPVLSQLFDSYKYSQFARAIDYADEYYDISKKTGDSLNIVVGGRMRAYTLIDLSRNEEAARILISVLGIARRNLVKYPELKKQIKFILNNAGLAYMYAGKYDKALDLQYQSLHIREEEGDKKSIRTALTNIGLIFYNLSDYEKAMQNYLKVVEISKDLNDFSSQERVYTNLGLCYNELKRFDEAIASFEESFGICGKNCDDNINKEGLEGLGIAYYTTHQLEKAKTNFMKSLEISKKLGDKRYASENLFYLGKLEMEFQNENQGIAYLKEAELLIESVNVAPVKLSIYKELADYYGLKRDYLQSLTYEKKYVQLKDSIYSSAMIKNLTAVQTDFAGREYIKRIKEREQLLQLKEEVIERQQIQEFLIGTCAVLFLFLAVVIYRSFRSKQLANYKLEEKVKERTAELREMNIQLQAKSKLTELNLKQVVQDGQGIVSRLKGLCNVAMLDLPYEDAKAYFQKVDGGTDQLSSLFSKVNGVGIGL